MKELDKWADRIYSENDFGRSIATSIAGIFGLVVYLFTNDWVISVFTLIIIFPVVRIISTHINNSKNHQRAIRSEKEKLESDFNKLSEAEKDVVKKFVEAGGSVLTWSQVNQLDIVSAAIESLMKRDLLFTSCTADGMRETFVLDQNLFDVGNEKFNE